MKTKTKPFDCVEMKRECQRKVARQLAGLTPKQLMKHWDDVYRAAIKRQAKKS